MRRRTAGKRTARGTKAVNLALQGGGAHGAFTWGVLDRLLQSADIRFDGLSGASAGAMNAVVMASGLLHGGAAGARAALERFWRDVADAARLSPLRLTCVEQLLHGWNADRSPWRTSHHVLLALLSPAQLNPFDLNPLRDILEQSVDFDGLRRQSELQLFIAATHVRSGQVRIFRNHELSVDALLASACLPYVFRAVEIEGEEYWDGGYTANPALMPVIDECRTTDLLIVQVNPMRTATVPRTAAEIQHRTEQLSVGRPLLDELRALDYARRLAASGVALGGRLRGKLRRLRLHLIAAEDELRALGSTSKLNADWALFSELRALGQQRAAAWLADDLPWVGKASTFDPTFYLEPRPGPAAPATKST